MIMLPDAHFLIVTVDKKYIIVLIPRDFVFRHRSFLHEFGFFTFLLAFAILVFMQLMRFKVSLGWRILRSFAVRL